MDTAMKDLLMVLIDRVGRLEQQLAAALEVKSAPKKPHISAVLEVFQGWPGAWMTASEVARQAGISTSAARMILYSNRDLFASERVSAGRVKWQLSPRQRIAPLERRLIESEAAMAS